MVARSVERMPGPVGGTSVEQRVKEDSVDEVVRTKLKVAPLESKVCMPMVAIWGHMSLVFTRRSGQVESSSTSSTGYMTPPAIKHVEDTHHN